MEGGGEEGGGRGGGGGRMERGVDGGGEGKTVPQGGGRAVCNAPGSFDTAWGALAPAPCSF